MKIAFHGVRKYGKRGYSPIVHAAVDGLPVMWDQRGWRCGHDCPDLNGCPHIDAVEELLDPSVIGEWYDQR